MILAIMVIETCTAVDYSDGGIENDHCDDGDNSDDYHDNNDCDNDNKQTHISLPVHLLQFGFKPKHFNR